uniref:SAP domain-containing protein n=1 Tax=Corethron hystrix TaxID=216773 RepID=A0A7S1BIU1_9STRA|mmetsp:Transcript_28811/g.65930  ORF Transcript_28811/g.65930 Transcript_28811/m.65930 type:complete len:725 (+) Transcript_28811:389-2563(+)
MMEHLLDASTSPPPSFPSLRQSRFRTECQRWDEVPRTATVARHFVRVCSAMMILQVFPVDASLYNQGPRAASWKFFPRHSCRRLSAVVPPPLHCSGNDHRVQPTRLFAFASSKNIGAGSTIISPWQRLSRSWLLLTPFSDGDSADELMNQQRLQIESLKGMLSDLQNNLLSMSKERMDSSSSELKLATTPLKAMLFIDGTWLYYSLYRREPDRCPIIQAYGLGWKHTHNFDWAALPRVIAQELERQMRELNWSTARPIEMVRAVVFTSYKATTDRLSRRITMFQEMAEANYEVHIMETTGTHEKCIDIQLAVEMVHFAGTDAYDVGILLSGDKDFMPALVRTRQKGKRVGIVSMRRGCNSALRDPNMHVKDFEIVWIDDQLDELLVPIEISKTDTNSSAKVAAATMMKVMYDFIISSPGGRVSSRDIGRYLKGVEISGTNMLEQLKLGHGGLRSFLLRHQGIFSMVEFNHKTSDPKDAGVFWVTTTDETDDILGEVAKSTIFSEVDEELLNTHNQNNINKERAYSNSLRIHREQTGLPPSSFDNIGGKDEQNDGDNYEIENADFFQYTVVQLKQMLRERYLSISGNKPDLVKRIEEDDKKRREAGRKQSRMRMLTNSFTLQKDLSNVGNIPLMRIVFDFIKKSPRGRVSSRDVGRYLKTITLPEGNTCLDQMKRVEGGLRNFLSRHQRLFNINLAQGSQRLMMQAIFWKQCQKHIRLETKPTNS